MGFHGDIVQIPTQKLSVMIIIIGFSLREKKERKMLSSMQNFIPKWPTPSSYKKQFKGPSLPLKKQPINIPM